MTRTVSETSLVSNIPSIQAESSQIVIHDEDENSNVLNIAEYCTNREVVNLENAAINVDNSTDVIFGPVTQLNVNGNVTIYSNGSPKQSINETGNQKERNGTNTENGDKRSYWENVSAWRNQPLKNKLSSRNDKYVKICGAILILSLGAIVTCVILYNTDKPFEYEERFYGKYLGHHRVYYRDEWNGRPPRTVVPLAHPTKFVIISHSASPTCDSFRTCSSLVKKFQEWHFSLQSFDIGYNFIIGGDGDVYVGRGWDVKNFHNDVSIGICFIGDFNVDELDENMIEAAKLLIEQGLNLEKISKNYILIGHNQSAIEVPISPGENVYKEIKNWPNFSNKTYFD